jgi:3-oxoacyl-[acyl-carrier-protein] synthase-3
LFSDGSSAFIPNLKEMKIIDSSFGYKKNSYEHLECNIEKNINMDGKKVYDFVSTDVYPALIKILKKNKNKKIDRIYIHQGSKFVVDFLKEKLKKFCNNIPTNIEKAGNFVSATIPMLISQDIKKEPFGNKENIILCGFGVGLAYSILVLEINKSKKN